jgi:putative OPT family oligopeptide transporter
MGGDEGGPATAPGGGFRPYVLPGTRLPELRILPLLVGCALGIVFGAASLYLALKIGITISASIPIAVMSISLFKWFSKVSGARNASILENNLVQTTGSAGESIAFGVAVTMPALLILGYDMDLPRIMTVAILGGLLGILMMIPLRRGLIVKSHGKLAFPEGTACAEVLVAGEKGGTNAVTVFTGFGIGFLFKLMTADGGLRIFKNVPERVFTFFKGGSVGAEVSPELMGVGYIIGPRTSGIMVAGGVLAYLVLIPAIAIFGDGLASPLFPADKLISEMGPHEIRNNYVLYIGAGAVAAGGIISLFKVLPTLVGAFTAGFRTLLSKEAATATVERTDRDLPLPVVVLGALALVVALMLVPALNVSLVGAVLIVLFGFLFVTVSSRLTGEIGSSSNPISGMTVATLLLTCLLFLGFGWTDPEDRLAALCIAAVVCIASSNGGTTAQDLKTGFLVGATPRAQQIGILAGALTSAVVIGYALKLFNDSATIFAKRDYAVQVDKTLFGEEKEHLFGPDAKHDANAYNVVHFTAESTPKNAAGEAMVPPGKYLVDDSGHIKYLVDPGINGVLTHRDAAPGEAQGAEVRKFDAPKARLMSLIIDGILAQKLPWGLVLLGVFIAVMMELCGIASLPFAVGVYLPIAASTPIFAGGILRWLVERKQKPSTAEDSSPGVLLSSGLIAGGAIAGMVLAIMAGVSEEIPKSLSLEGSLGWFAQSDLVALGFFALLGLFVLQVARGKLLAPKR